MEKVTLEDIERLDKEFLDIADVAKYLGKNPQPIRETIRRGVPWAYVMGNADFRIPKRLFVHYHKYGVGAPADGQAGRREF